MNSIIKYQQGIRIFLYCIALFFFSTAYAQPDRRAFIDSSKIPVPHPHFLPEYNFDAPTDIAAWQNEKKGLQVSFASTDEAYFRTEVPALQNKAALLNEVAWKGERINAMLLVWSTDSINQVRFILNDLKDDKGNILSKKNCKLNVVKYVVSNYPYDAKEVTCGEGPVDKAYLMPDLFEPMATGADRFDLPGKTVRPVWFSVDVPQSTMPVFIKELL